MMKKFRFIFGILVATGLAFSVYSFVGPHQKVSALSGSQFNPGRIIDDSVFYQPGSMTASQIQSFFNQEVPTCDTNGTQIYSGSETRAQYGTSQGYPPPYTCLKSYTQNTPAENAISGICSYLAAKSNDSAADIISRVSSACGVNPKVMIVLLQKEQGLVTDTWPWSIEYKIATGYGCPDSSGCDANYYGFFNQVYDAAWQFKEYQANPTNFSYVAGQNNNILYNPNTACGHETVYIQNEATAGLYDYTPYVPNAAALKNVSSTNDGGLGNSCSSYGNRNFWWYFNTWFGSPYGTPFFSINGGSARYVLGANNNYYHVTSPSEMASYGFNNYFFTVTSEPSSYISGLTNGGDLPLITYFDSGNAVYLIDGGGAHSFPTQTILNAYGYTTSEAANLPGWIYDTLSHPSDMQLVAKQNSAPEVYYMQSGKKSHIINQTAYDTLGSPTYSSLPTVTLTSAYVQSLPTGAPIMPEGTLTRTSDTDAFGIWNGTSLQPLSSTAGNDIGSNYYSAPASVINQLASSGTTVGKLVKDSSSNMFILDNAQKFAVSSGQLANLGLNSTSFVTTDNVFLSSLPTNNSLPTLPNPTLVRINGTDPVYLIQNGDLYRMASRADFEAMGYSMANVVNTNMSTHQLFSGTGEYLIANGDLVRIKNTINVYLVNYSTAGTFEKLLIPSQIIFNDYGFNPAKIDNVDGSFLNGYTTSGNLPQIVKDSSSNLWLVDSGSKHVISATLQGSGYYNINPSSTQALSDNAINNISTGSDLTFVIKANNGDSRIYKVANGQKEWFTSWQSFVNNGGTAAPISYLSPTFVNSLPNGPNIN